MLVREPGPRRGQPRFKVSQRFGHRPGLDAVRGIAVAVILVVHSWPHAAGAGIVSVDVFFTLSGFLITTLILQEVDRSGRLALREFWGRRIRRLVPALVVVTAAVVVAALAGAFRNTTVARDSLAAFTWSSNWAQSGGDYFAEVGAQSPFEHFWTLAIEEQFYVVLPIVVGLLAWRTQRVRLGLGVIAVVGVIACTWRSWTLSTAGASVNRLYMGTDTRAIALLVGVAVAVAMFGRWTLRHRARLVVTSLAALVLAGWVAAAALGWSPTIPGLARGGWFAVAIASSIVVMAACQESVGAFFARIGPVMWLGTRSYGLYLWHLPILLLVGRSTSGLHELAALALTAVVAETSYRIVERPVITRRSSWATHGGLAALAGAATLAAIFAPFGAPTTAERLAVASANHTDAPPTVPIAATGGAATSADGLTTSTAGATTTTAAPVPVLVWGDDFAPVVAAALAADPRLAVTTEAHPECDGPGRCRDLSPTPDGAAMVVVAISDPERFGAPISSTMDPAEPGRLAREVWDRWSGPIGATPVALVTPPEERLDLGPIGSLRHLVGATAANVVLGTNPESWANDVAARVAGAVTPKVLLVGDSVAWSLAASFSPANTVVWDRTQHGCNTAAGDLVRARGGRDRRPPVCDWRTDWANHVAAFDPDVVVVHVGTWESYDQWISGASAPAGEAVWAQAQRDQFAGVFDVAGAQGAHVMLVIEAPAWETAADKPAETKPEESARRMPAVLAAAREAAAGRPNVTVLDAGDAVCAERGCERPDLRDDGVHYTPEGARLVGSWLEPHLAATASKRPPAG